MFIGNICVFFVFAAAIIVITNVTFIQLFLYDARVAGFRNFFYYFEMISDFSCLARSFLMISYFAVFAVYFEWHTTELQIWTHLFFVFRLNMERRIFRLMNSLYFISFFRSSIFLLSFPLFLSHKSLKNQSDRIRYIHSSKWSSQFFFFISGACGEEKKRERHINL